MVSFGNLSEELNFNSKEVYLLSQNEEDISSIGESLSKAGILLFNFDPDNIDQQDQRSMLLVQGDMFANLDSETYDQKIKSNHFVFSYADSDVEIAHRVEGHITLPLKQEDLGYMIDFCHQKSFYETKLEELESKHLALQKVSGLGRFTGSLVHDLNNYNTICMTAFDGIKLVNKKKIQNEKVDFLVSKGLKGCKMINSLSLKYRRFMFVDDNAESEYFSLNKLVYEALEYTEKDLNQYSITYKSEVSKGLEILCSDTSFIQVLVNMISNSIFEIKDQQSPWISIKTRARKGMIVLYIVDSGNGIPKEIRTRIFDPLFTTKSKSEGTGFGLNFCLQELKKMGMKLEYVDNKNTAFAIEIPVEKIKSQK